jgi:hypothetical protein
MLKKCCFFAGYLTLRIAKRSSKTRYELFRKKIDTFKEGPGDQFKAHKILSYIHGLNGAVITFQLLF